MTATDPADACIRDFAIALRSSNAASKRSVRVEPSQIVRGRHWRPIIRERAWLAEARVSARARVVEAQLVRTPQGDYAGSLVLVLGARP